MSDEIRAAAARALDELHVKSLAQIQAETAETWAWRAWAARKLDLHTDAVEYEHEAIEHAALCGDDSMLARVRAIVSAT